MRPRLYLDMDGVLADFNANLRRFGVEDNETHFIHKPRSEWTPAQVDLDRRVREVMENPSFWPSIPMMDGARYLWEFCQQHFEVFVLTATPAVTEWRHRIARQKREWIGAYFGAAPRVITCLRSEKKQYAKAGTFLVDDMPANCDEWARAGGIPIRFKSASQAITLLRQHMGLAPAATAGRRQGYSPDTHYYDPESETIKPLTVVGLRAKTSAERKAEPIHSGVMLYFPDALAAVSRISKAGNDKHNPGEPLHWARGKSMDQMDASARHMLTLETVDPETGEVEAAANAWRALAQLQLIEERRLAKAGVKSYSGIAP